MEAYYSLKPCCLYACHLHQRCIHNGLTVIGEKNCSRLFKLFHRHKLFSLHIHGDVATGVDVDAGLTATLQHVLYCIHIVHVGICVAHHYDTGKAASGCCPGAGFDVFFISKSRIPEVNMPVHKARSHNAASGVYLCILFACLHHGSALSCYLIKTATKANPYDLLSIDQDVKDTLCFCSRIHDPSVLYQQHACLLRGTLFYTLT